MSYYESKEKERFTQHGYSIELGAAREHKVPLWESSIPEELPSSPSSKARLSDSTSIAISAPNAHTTKACPVASGTSPPDSQAVKGSIRLLFASLQKKDIWILAIAITLSVSSGAIPALMTRVLGSAFDAYTVYNVANLPAAAVSQAEKDRLISSIIMSVWQLCVLAAGTMILSNAMISVWIVIGERVAAKLRSRVYISVSQRKMKWFDLGMGQNQDDSKDVEGQDSEVGEGAETEGGIGCGGLTAKFARETDDVRIATGQQAGLLVQHLTVALSSLVLALATNWSLTLVILASIPIAGVITIGVEMVSGPLLVAERAATSRACGLVERVVTSIATVKAFNGEQKEMFRFVKILGEGYRAYLRVSRWWGLRQGISNFLMFCMFVQGFWYGSFLVQSGRATAGTVMSVFWAALLTSSHLQMIIQALNIIEKGKVGAAGLERLMTPDADNEGQRLSHRASSSFHATQKHGRDSLKFGHASTGTAQDAHQASFTFSSPPSSASPTATSFTHLKRARRTVAMRGIRPRGDCKGEVTLQNITFCYPSIQASSPDASPTLKNVDMFIPAGEATFIVGGSGSGKSTIAQLLLRLYSPDSGSIQLDGQECKYLDRDWYRTNIASVDQHPIVFDLSVHDNVALGLIGRGVAGQIVQEGTHVPVVERDQVIAACRTALLHDFVKGLPDGYDTMLGARGAALSGGQKQRLAIARARLRDPAVLILDEATSALDLTSRLLVNEAIKTWRRGKTTIIITHDLSQVENDDFLYMMKDGQIVEHGYRGALEQLQGGHFDSLARQQRQNYQGGDQRDSLELDSKATDIFPPVVEDFVSEEGYPAVSAHRRTTRRDDLASALGLPLGFQKDDLITALGLEDYPEARLPSPTLSSQNVGESVQEEKRESSVSVRQYRSPFMYTKPNGQSEYPRKPRISATAITSPRIDAHSARLTDSSTLTHLGTRMSTGDPIQDPFRDSYSLRRPKPTDTSSAAVTVRGLRMLRLAEQQQAGLIADQAPWIEKAGKAAFEVRRKGSQRQSLLMTLGSTPQYPAQMERRRWSDSELSKFLIPVSTNGQHKLSNSAITRDGLAGEPDFTVLQPAKTMATLLWAFSSSPCKVVLIVGLFCCLVGGAVTPIFSYFLGLLLSTMAQPGQTSAVLRYSLAVLGLAVLEGIFAFLRSYLMELAGEKWINSLRRRGFAKILDQDKTWFDGKEAGAGVLVNKIIKDAEDARNLIAMALEILIVVAAMVTIGLIWAMFTGWQLTLVGVALIPLFVGATVLQSRAIGKFEARNKARRETVAKRFYDLVSNIRGIRSMALEPVFAAQFFDALVATERDAIRAAPLSGFAVGLADGLVYLAQALMFYVGAVLITRGIYDFQRMVITFNLIIFAVTFATQLMGYLPGLTKSIQATSDLRKLVALGDDKNEREKDIDPSRISPMYSAASSASSEKFGSLRPTIRGTIIFRDVHFAYPSRPDVPVLQGASFEICSGETIAIVGASGCGKSTVAALLQRLYEPTGGGIFIDGLPLGSINAKHLRDYTAVVSQHPNLFDMSIAENVAYGWLQGQGEQQGGPSRTEIERACMLARADAFVKVLPKGYDTSMGESASLVSGGQRQRLAIARALLRVLPSFSPGSPSDGKIQTRGGASLLILDEATSALDDINRRVVVETLLSRRREVCFEGSSSPTLHSLLVNQQCQVPTVLLITHKLDEMKACQRILVFDHGRVVQAGTYAGLLKEKGGVFARLASAGEWGA